MEDLQRLVDELNGVSVARPDMPTEAWQSDSEELECAYSNRCSNRSEDNYGHAERDRMD
jgi:hypothetical protein